MWGKGVVSHQTYGVVNHTWSRIVLRSSHFIHPDILPLSSGTAIVNNKTTPAKNKELDDVGLLPHLLSKNQITAYAGHSTAPEAAKLT